MAKFCEVQENQDVCLKCGVNLNNSNNNNNNYNNTSPVVERNIAVSIILSLVTCGIYGLYWFIMITDESNRVSNDKEAASGGMALLFTLITCGIYGFYWSYKMGKKMYEAGKIHNKDFSDNSVLYLILSILGLGIVNYCLIQSDLNKLAK